MAEVCSAPVTPSRTLRCLAAASATFVRSPLWHPATRRPPTQDDVQALRTAVATLEHPRLAARRAEIAGEPIELFNRALPEPASKAIAAATTQALNTALRVALRTMHNDCPHSISPVQNLFPGTEKPRGPIWKTRTERPFSRYGKTALQGQFKKPDYLYISGLHRV
jgi:hypothetical protein